MASGQHLQADYATHADAIHLVQSFDVVFHNLLRVTTALELLLELGDFFLNVVESRNADAVCLSDSKAGCNRDRLLWLSVSWYMLIYVH